uniref:Iron-sulfur cluster co-chaperone protein HscB, mitochondrial-like n=1 Tax=Saccoglossus kowalevskii TaxID=10224 RepID=A0ABM0MGB2_SACKO|nr:PREDICTED: iron-sulfur cluster co-chaperone protein HscB, mitochondrial-like [Saccoglossus kowalevskii]
MGRSINEHDQNVDMAFLAEIMEVNEEIADAKTKPELLKIDDKNKTKLDQLVHDLSKAFSKNDLDTARELLRKMKYYVNIEMKIKEKLMPTAS